MATMAGQNHGEAMDRIYRWQRHIYDATRRYYLLGRMEMLSGLKPRIRGSVLEIGCGTANNLVRLGQIWPNCTLYGIDISRVMLEQAEASLTKAGLSERTKLAQGDATRFDAQALFGRQQFDEIMMSYTLSMIPEWEAALDQAIALMAPGGTLSLVDFGPCENWPKPLHRLLQLWLKAFSVSPRHNLMAVLAHKAAENGLKLTLTHRYGGYAVIAKMTRLKKGQ